jgi:hypothetical protein
MITEIRSDALWASRLSRSTRFAALGCGFQTNQKSTRPEKRWISRLTRVHNGSGVPKKISLPNTNTPLMKSIRLTTMIALTGLLLASHGSPFNASAQAEPPIISTGWVRTTLEKQELMRQAERTLRSLGYTGNLSVMSESVYGTRGDYAATIRPIAGSVVFFITAGPESSSCDAQRARLTEKFSE